MSQLRTAMAMVVNFCMFATILRRIQLVLLNIQPYICSEINAFFINNNYDLLSFSIIFFKMHFLHFLFFNKYKLDMSINLPISRIIVNGYGSGGWRESSANRSVVGNVCIFDVRI